MKDEYPKKYLFKARDFIPIAGFIGHARRCAGEKTEFKQMIHANEEFSYWYNTESGKRGLVLGIYNVALAVTGTVGALAGLSKLLG